MAAENLIMWFPIISSLLRTVIGTIVQENDCTSVDCSLIFCVHFTDQGY